MCPPFGLEHLSTEVFDDDLRKEAFCSKLENSQLKKVDTGEKKFRTVGLFPNFGQIFGMMGQMFSTLNRREKEGRKMKRGRMKEREEAEGFRL